MVPERITTVSHQKFIDQLARRLPDYLLNWSRMASHFPLELIYSNRKVSHSDRVVKDLFFQRSRLQIEPVFFNEVQCESQSGTGWHIACVVFKALLNVLQYMFWGYKIFPFKLWNPKIQASLCMLLSTAIQCQVMSDQFWLWSDIMSYQQNRD